LETASELREPSQLRAWLCGITRFLVANKTAPTEHEPIHAANRVTPSRNRRQPIPHPRRKPSPAEEEAILWRALERIPTLPEPFDLFYREQHRSSASAAS